MFYEKTKKKSLIGGVFKAAAVFAALGLAVRKCVEINKVKTAQRDKENEGSTIKNYEVLMNGREVHLEEPVTELNIKVKFGGICIDLTKAQMEGELKVNVSALFGGVDIILPYGVNATCNGACLFGGIYSVVPEYEGDAVPMMTLDYKMALAGLNIRTEVRQDELVKDYFDESSFQNLSKEELESARERTTEKEMHEKAGNEPVSGDEKNSAEML